MPNGNCFEAALKHFQRLHDEGEPNLSLCHGLVTNGERRSFPYAWIEKVCAIDSYVFDLRNDDLLIVTKRKYYRLLKIKGAVRYEVKEALIESLKHQNFGPWDEQLAQFDRLLRFEARSQTVDRNSHPRIGGSVVAWRAPRKH